MAERTTSMGCLTLLSRSPPGAPPASPSPFTAPPSLRSLSRSFLAPSLLSPVGTAPPSARGGLVPRFSVQAPPRALGRGGRGSSVRSGPCAFSAGQAPPRQRGVAIFLARPGG